MNHEIVKKLKIKFNDFEKIKLLYKVTSQELDEEIYNLLNFKLKSEDLRQLHFKNWINYDESFIKIKDIKSLIFNNNSLELNDENKEVLRHTVINLLIYKDTEKRKYNNKFVLAKTMSDFAKGLDNQENITLTTEFLNRLEKSYSVITLLEEKINEIKNIINELLEEE